MSEKEFVDHLLEQDDEYGLPKHAADDPELQALYRKLYHTQDAIDRANAMFDEIADSTRSIYRTGHGKFTFPNEVPTKIEIAQGLLKGVRDTLLGIIAIVIGATAGTKPR